MKKKIKTITGILLCGLLLGFVIGVTSCDSGFFGTLDELKTKAEGEAVPVPGIFAINPEVKALPSADSGAAPPSISVVIVGGINNDEWMLSKDASATWLTLSLDPDGSDAGATVQGTGASPVYLVFTANNDALARTANIFINGSDTEACKIVQDGIPGYKIVPDEKLLPNTGSGSSPQYISVDRIVTKNPDTWTLSTNVTWLTFSKNPDGSSPATTVNGSGSSTPVYLVVTANNTNVDRPAKIYLNGNISTSSCVVTQAGVPGIYTINPATISVPNSATDNSPKSVSVVYKSGDSTDLWELSTDKTWLKFSLNSDGSGASGTVSGSGASTPVYLVAEASDTFAVRTANIFIDGNAAAACVVSQAGDPGVYKVDPVSISAPKAASGAAPRSVSVIYVSGAVDTPWTLSTNAAANWLMFSLNPDGSDAGSTKSGSGPATPVYLVTTEGVYGVTRTANIYINGSSSAACVVDDTLGTSIKPFEVNNLGDLLMVGSGTDGWTLSAHYRQTDDINLAGLSNWTPIGSDTNRFTGAYDGGNYSIINLTVSRPNYVGLFGYIDGGTVQNVKLTGNNVTNTSAGYYSYTGGIVGYLDNGSTAINCSVTGPVTGTSYAGGVAGYSNNSTIKNCFSSGNINATAYSSSSSPVAGGVVGYINNGIIEYCYATGNVTSDNGTENIDYIYSGGLAGRSWNSTVRYCYATGNVSTTNKSSNPVFTQARAGGLIGSISRDGTSVTAEFCYATGDVVCTGSDISGDSRVFAGGFAGEVSVPVQNCYATGSVSGSNSSNGTENWICVGGMAGHNSQVMQNCYATGSVSLSIGSGGYQAVYAGGIAGSNWYYLITRTVALNPGIERLAGTSGDFTRVAGGNDSMLTDNYARSDMKVLGSTVSAGGNNGADFATGSALSSIFNATNGWNSGVWAIPGGNLAVGCALPTLIGMPVGTQDPRLPAAVSP